MLDLDAIWGFLRTSYWAAGIPRTRIVLGTADAHGLYERFGFAAVNRPA